MIFILSWLYSSHVVNRCLVSVVNVCLSLYVCLSVCLSPSFPLSLCVWLCVWLTPVSSFSSMVNFDCPVDFRFSRKPWIFVLSWLSNLANLYTDTRIHICRERERERERDNLRLLDWGLASAVWFSLGSCFFPILFSLLVYIGVTSALKVYLRECTIMQIMTGIDINSEADFPKLREYCPSAEGTRQYSRNWGKSASLLIDDDRQSLFVLLYLWSKWRRNSFNYLCYFTLVFLHNSNNNKSSSADKVMWRCEAAQINQIYLLH